MGFMWILLDLRDFIDLHTDQWTYMNLRQICGLNEDLYGFTDLLYVNLRFTSNSFLLCQALSLLYVYS